MTVHYLNLAEVAERIGLKSADMLKGYKLPPPDITLGQRNRGWSAQTIDAWNRDRPRRGASQPVDDQCQNYSAGGVRCTLKLGHSPLRNRIGHRYD